MSDSKEASAKASAGSARKRWLATVAGAFVLIGAAWGAYRARSRITTTSGAFSGALNGAGHHGVDSRSVRPIVPW